MEPNTRFRSAVRVFYFWIASTVLLGAAPLLALHLVNNETTLSRVAAVVVGTGGMLPWMWILVTIVRKGDEFFQRLHLIAVAAAFGGTLVLVVALGWLVRADFIDPPDLIVVWAGGLVIWLIALLVTKYHFERTR
jgi:hypothetical protein